MLQSIEVLQLTSADLLSLIERELEQNETLVADASAADEPRIADENGAAERDPELDRDRFDSLCSERPAAGTGEPDGKRAFLENVAGRSESLLDHVLSQLGWLELPREVVEGVSTLAERLDERGLLTDTDEELLAVLDQEALDQCVAVLQSLEPRGIGARDPIGAMLLQVSPQDPDYPDIAVLLREHLDALARNKLPEVAALLGRTLPELQDLLDRIKRLDPRPGASFEAGSVRETIHPDVVVRLVGGRIEIQIDDMILPDLGIRSDYADMAADRAVDRETRSYLRGKLRSARELIHAVEQRKRTLGRVTAAIMQHQLEFLVSGPAEVRPLGMGQISDQVGLHPSTVSRAIAGKHVQTDHGIFRLRDFFDGDRRVRPGNGGKGRMAIKDLVRDLIAAEDPAAPLSDDDLVARLLAKNVKVARRTVAKYRKEVGLPSSWRRKRHAGPDADRGTQGELRT